MNQNEQEVIPNEQKTNPSEQEVNTNEQKTIAGEQKSNQNKQETDTSNQEAKPNEQKTIHSGQEPDPNKQETNPNEQKTNPNEPKTIPYEDLNLLGLGQKDFSPEDAYALLNGQKTSVLKFSIDDSPEKRKILEKEKVDFKVEDGKLHFEGRIQLQKYMTVDKTEENKNILRNANIDFEEFQGNKLKLSHDSLRKLAIGATVLISPVTAVALMLIPKRTEIKNDMSLNQNQINDLKSGEVIGRYNEKNERILMQLDKNTNNIVTVKTKDIFVPDKLIEQHLTPLQKEQLKNGREIQLKTEDGKTVFAKLDLNEKSGFILKNEKGQKLNIDAYGKRPAKKENKNNMKI